MPANRHMKHLGTLLLLLFLSLPVMAQQKNPMFYSEIRLQHKPYTLQSITEEIQAQTGISFSYNADQISPGTRIRIKGNRATVAAVLGTIRKKTGIGYKIISQNHIIYTPPVAKTVRPQKLKRSTRSGRITDEMVKRSVAVPSSIKTYGIAPTSSFKDTSDDNAIMMVGDSSVMAGYYFGGGTGGGGTAKTEEPEDPDFPEYEWDDAPNRYAARQQTLAREDVLQFFKTNTLFAAGISTDETYYFDPGIRIGFDFLYGTVAYNIGGGGTPTWRFGLGSSVKLNERWRLHASISTGAVITSNYDIVKFDTIPPTDSIQEPTFIETHTPLSVSSRLTRYGISTSYHLGKGFFLEGGLALNRMTTNYYSYNNPIALADILPFGVDADSKYYAIKPPYVLGSNYTANKPSNTRIWIGVQLTFYYRLNFLGY